MMDSVEIIELYENVASISGRMLDAARLGDWELLEQLERDCSIRIQTLRENVDEPAELSADQRLRKISIIKKILADDKEIRTITEPWMAQLDNLMQAARNTHNLMRAYQGNPGA